MPETDDAVSDKAKFPRIPHLPWSGTRTTDDLTVSADWRQRWLHGAGLAITEKLDGECTTLTRQDCYARSPDSTSHHPSRHRIKALWAATIQGQIPAGVRICGENMYARHSIRYTALPSYFIVHTIFAPAGLELPFALPACAHSYVLEDTHCLSWEETEMVARQLGLPTVPLLYCGPWRDTSHLQRFVGWPSQVGGEQCEGYVVRPSGGFLAAWFGRLVAKYVRPGHVAAGDTHWRRRPVEPNGLARARLDATEG
jgi:hypothetical protein